MHEFYSDTQTRPTRAMREAALNVTLGDERHNEDPSTNELCTRVAEMLGMEAAVFPPLGLCVMKSLLPYIQVLGTK